MALLSRMRRVVFGSPIATENVAHTLLPKRLALPIYASDAISSVVYASQQIMLALGAAGLWLVSERERYSHYTILLSAIIVALLVIVVTSYWQTIFAYPGGGGSYIVTKENLGTNAALVAAGALLVDYVLTVAVSLASGMQNLADIPFVRRWGLDEYVVEGCLGAILLLTLANLRGLKESGRLFGMFTYGFVALCFLMVVLGLAGPYFGWQFDLSEIELTYRSFPTVERESAQAVSGFGLVVLLHAFANGCCAMTGTEAVSNGIPSFAEPKARNAAVTLIWMAVILGGLFLGISVLAMQLHVVYWEHNGETAPSVIDQLSGAVFGKSGALSPLYLLTQLFTAALLVLAANTSYADFPRLSSILARDNFMPRQLATLGDRLVFHHGILLLGLFAGALIVAKHGSVDALIPLYAFGVFLAFTLSQAGMVVHWLRLRNRGWRRRAVINGVGAASTALVLVDIAVEKFADGAWMIMAVLVLLFLVFRRIQSHYEYVRKMLSPDRSDNRRDDQLIPKEHVVIVPVSGLHGGIFPALEYGLSISPSCRAVFVDIAPEQSADLPARWERAIPHVPLTVLPSPFRSLVRPLIEYLDSLQGREKNKLFTVIVPEFVTPHIWQRALHGNSAMFIRLALAGRRDVVITSVRYHLAEVEASGRTNVRGLGAHHGRRKPSPHLSTHTSSKS